MNFVAAIALVLLAPFLVVIYAILAIVIILDNIILGVHPLYSIRNKLS